jgi:maltose-binding protein MalE
MKMVKTLVFLASTSIVLSTVAVAGAPKKKKEVQRIHQDRVLSVSSDSISISHQSIDQKASLEDKGKRVMKDVVRVYKINSWTEVQVDGKRATPSDIKTGMAVTVSGSAPTNADGDGGVAATIIAHTAKALGKPGV